ncbi:MAG: hypothetical protein JL50_19660 [Peptococcaceae bacterium BICA1-7]|nr:MAG: hypothetical protein JL50_19660 [Peptococcaceae bacterium BICA1-7]HBV98294.1 PilZ domain-containing protein [Desulfotomaculum sp.]
MERRRFSRVDFHMGAIIRYRHKSFRGEVQNISLNGVSIKISEKIAAGEIVEVMISLTGDSSCLSINLEGVVLRTGEEGIALQYRKVDLDAFIHLRNIVSYNLDNSDKVMEEFQSFIGGNNTSS